MNRALRPLASTRSIASSLRVSSGLTVPNNLKLAPNRLNMSRAISASAGSSMRHLVSISELSSKELHSLVSRAAHYKRQIKTNQAVAEQTRALVGKTIALLFTKRSTRTRISCEAAVSYLGGHPLFLGSQDIQLGVNEAFLDTTKVVSSMTSGIFARVDAHRDIQELVKHSSVPVINSLCDKYHPLQAICDVLTIKEVFGSLRGRKLAWVGDANNVINDLAVASLKYGMDVAVALPPGYQFDAGVAAVARATATEQGATFEITHDAVAALEGASVVVTDTFVSMGEEAQKAQKLKEFQGFQVNEELLGRARPAADWRFMHCLPRHKEEVSDGIFYGDRSVVFEEAENRLYAALAAIEAFIINKGEFI